MTEDQMRLADGLHARHCANPDCGGRAAHEAETGISYAELVEGNLADGWVAPGGPREVFGPFPVDAKVWAATVWGSVAGVLSWLLPALAENIDVLAPVLAAAPPWVGVGVRTLVVALATFYGAYRAQHSPRPV